VAEGLDDGDGPRSFSAPLTPDINVTPLVDVVLVLLIIFMVVAPQMESGASVELPAMSNPDQALEQDAQPTILSLARDGALYFDKRPVATGDLERLLRDFRAAKPEARLVLKADRDAAYGKVRALFKLCQDLGFPGVALQVIDRQNQTVGT
jgi:biopolymer transport protein TolR